MKVLFDHQIFELQDYGGISRYFTEVFKSFNESNSLTWNISILYSNNFYLKNLNNPELAIKPNIVQTDPYFDFLPGLNFKGKKLLYLTYIKFWPPKLLDGNLANKNSTIELLKKGDFDVFHPTYYDDYFLEYLGDKPFILTVHDLTEEIFPELSIQDKRHKGESIIKKASRIIAVSENTKRDLVNIYGVDPEKIEVIYLASSLTENNKEISASVRELADKRYLLYVGKKTAYKNFYFFLRMFASLNEKDLHVICTGSPFSNEDLLYLKKLGITDRVQTTFVNDGELSYLYQHAVAFVFPSLYEGFGIPILEAFQNSCPVLASNGSSLKEIGQDSALYFEPKDPESMLTALKSIVNNHILREELKVKGLRRATDFSWKKTAQKTLEVYKMVLDKSKALSNN